MVYCPAECSKGRSAVVRQDGHGKEKNEAVMTTGSKALEGLDFANAVAIATGSIFLLRRCFEATMIFLGT